MFKITSPLKAKLNKLNKVNQKSVIIIKKSLIFYKDTPLTVQKFKPKKLKSKNCTRNLTEYRDGVILKKSDEQPQLH